MFPDTTSQIFGLFSLFLMAFGALFFGDFAEWASRVWDRPTPNVWAIIVVRSFCMFSAVSIAVQFPWGTLRW